MDSLFDLSQKPAKPRGYMPVEFDSTEWETPPEIFNPLHREFNFTVDVAARKWNTKIPDRYFTPELNGLGQSWRSETVWCNPPYGAKEIEKWLKKAITERENGTTSVLLLPASIDRIWFYTYVWDVANNRPRPGIELRFFEGRIKFLVPPELAGRCKGEGNVTGSILVIVRPVKPGITLPCCFCGK
jgi:phage N-6-adenine-methyltransferase